MNMTVLAVSTKPVIRQQRPNDSDSLGMFWYLDRLTVLCGQGFDVMRLCPSCS